MALCRVQRRMQAITIYKAFVAPTLQPKLFTYLRITAQMHMCISAVLLTALTVLEVSAHGPVVRAWDMRQPAVHRAGLVVKIFITESALFVVVLKVALRTARAATGLGVEAAVRVRLS